MQTNPEGTWCPPSLEGAAKFVLPVQFSRRKIIYKEIKDNTTTNAFFPSTSSLHHFPVHQRAQQIPTPHPLLPSQNFVKIHYNIGCCCKCGSQTHPGFPILSGHPVCQRVQPVGNRAYPCGYQLCVFQGTTKLLPSPSPSLHDFPVKEEDSAPRFSTSLGGTPIWPQPSGAVAPARETPVLSVARCCAGICKGLLFYFLEQERVQ